MTSPRIHNCEYLNQQTQPQMTIRVRALSEGFPLQSAIRLSIAGVFQSQPPRRSGYLLIAYPTHCDEDHVGRARWDLSVASPSFTHPEVHAECALPPTKSPKGVVGLPQGRCAPLMGVMTPEEVSRRSDKATLIRVT